MNNLSPDGFLTGLLRTFFGAVVMDFLLTAIGLDKFFTMITIYLISAIVLSVLLYARLIQLHQNRVWAVLGLIPPLGLAFGIYLYINAPTSEERHVETS
jgi:hypothetical protein